VAGLEVVTGSEVVAGTGVVAGPEVVAGPGVAGQLNELYNANVKGTKKYVRIMEVPRLEFIHYCFLGVATQWKLLT